MKCDKCNKPAVVHEVTIKNGVKAEVHLCDVHAAEAGFFVHQASGDLKEMLQQVLVSQPGPGGQSVGKAGGKSCPQCGFRLAEFKKTGTLGCPMCYQAFGRELQLLVERAQGGATHHIGKAPMDRSAAALRQTEMRRLMHELDLAVAAEEYERAARLRDQLNQLEPIGDDDADADSASADAGDCGT